MKTFSQFLTEQAKDFDMALRNFVSKVLEVPGKYAPSFRNVKTFNIINAQKAREYEEDQYGEKTKRPEKFDDSKYAYITFGSATDKIAFLVSVDRNSGDIDMDRVYFNPGEQNIFKGFGWEQVRQRKVFEKVTLYLEGGMGNIVRVDCRELHIETGPYAQYSKTIHVKYLEKGKSKWRGTVIGYKPFVVVVPTAKAIQPDSLFGEPDTSSTPGISVSRSRYSSFDPRFVSDFVDKLKDAKVPILWSHEEVR